MDDDSSFPGSSFLSSTFGRSFFRFSNSSSGNIDVFHPETPVTNFIVDHMPRLRQPFKPPLWVRNGHLQTFGFWTTKFSKAEVDSRRYRVTAPDGATVTFDVFEPSPDEQWGIGVDVTVCLVPGLGNSAESGYVRSCAKFLRSCGFRVAVLNHLGTVAEVPLTSPRIFCYGNTEEYDLMVRWVIERYSESLFFSVGFSMGANIVTKHLGEHHTAKPFLGALSVGQCYDAIEAYRNLTLRHKPYMWAMTRGMKKFLRAHEIPLFLSPRARDVVNAKNIDVDQLFNANDLQAIDENYYRRFWGFATLEEFYTSQSCFNYLANIEIPIMFLNARDDPLVPDQLIDLPRPFVSDSGSAILVTTKYGGHLGYFEGGSHTWLEKFIVEYCDSLLLLRQAEIEGAVVTTHAHRDASEDGKESGCEGQSIQETSVSFV